MKSETFLWVIGIVWVVLGISMSFVPDGELLSAIYNTTGSLFFAIAYALIEIKEILISKKDK